MNVLPKKAKIVKNENDAAGMIDPLTGEGIHTAMIGSKIAAQTIDDMYKMNNFYLFQYLFFL